MNQQIEKLLLEFNGVTILHVVKNGMYWIALQSVCEALGINYDTEYQILKVSKVFVNDFADWQVPAPGEEERIMVCLTERSIYGFFPSHDNSKDFMLRRKEFYDALFDYCRSNTTGRARLIEQKAKLQLRRKHLMETLRGIDEYVELEHIIASEARNGSDLKKMNINDLDQQLRLFEGES